MGHLKSIVTVTDIGFSDCRQAGDPKPMLFRTNQPSKERDRDIRKALKGQQLTVTASSSIRDRTEACR